MALIFNLKTLLDDEHRHVNIYECLWYGLEYFFLIAAIQDQLYDF